MKYCLIALGGARAP